MARNPKDLNDHQKIKPVAVDPGEKDTIGNKKLFQDSIHDRRPPRHKSTEREKAIDEGRRKFFKTALVGSVVAAVAIFTREQLKDNPLIFDLEKETKANDLAAVKSENYASSGKRPSAREVHYTKLKTLIDTQPASLRVFERELTNPFVQKKENARVIAKAIAYILSKDNKTDKQALLGAVLRNVSYARDIQYITETSGDEYPDNTVVTKTLPDIAREGYTSPAATNATASNSFTGNPTLANDLNIIISCLPKTTRYK